MDLIYCTTRLMVYTFSAQLNRVSVKCRLSVNTSALQQNRLFYCSQATIFGTSYMCGRVQDA